MQSTDVQARPVPDREVTARRLLAGSARRSFDPRVDVAWDEPWVEGRLFVPERAMTLFGSDLWEAMPISQRAELSRCELANGAAMGIWFEMTFLPMLVGALMRHPYPSDHLRYGLTEIADECRHSACSPPSSTSSIVARALNREVHAALTGTVYNSGCSSYYLSDGRNIANWPWSLARLHRRFRFDVADYVVQDHLTTDQEGRS